MNEQALLKKALELGFANAALVDTADVTFIPAFRPLCQENLCGKYGVNYACPPDCGTVEEMRRKLQSWPRALVMQTMWDIDDAMDERQPKPANKPGAEVGNDIAIKVRADKYIVILRMHDKAHTHCVHNAVVKRNLRVFLRNLPRNVKEQPVSAFHDVCFMYGSDFFSAFADGIFKGIAHDAFTALAGD